VLLQGGERANHLKIVRKHLVTLRKVEQPFQMPVIEGSHFASAIRLAKQFPKPIGQRVGCVAVVLPHLQRLKWYLSLISFHKYAGLHRLSQDGPAKVEGKHMGQRTAVTSFSCAGLVWVKGLLQEGGSDTAAVGYPKDPTGKTPNATEESEALTKRWCTSTTDIGSRTLPRPAIFAEQTQV
jgi:hypothetical protein